MLSFVYLNRIKNKGIIYSEWSSNLLSQTHKTALKFSYLGLAAAGGRGAAADRDWGVIVACAGVTLWSYVVRLPLSAVFNEGGCGGSEITDLPTPQQKEETLNPEWNEKWASQNGPIGCSVWRSPCDDQWRWDGLQIVNLFPDDDRHHSLLFVIHQRDNVNRL